MFDFNSPLPSVYTFEVPGIIYPTVLSLSVLYTPLIYLIMRIPLGTPGIFFVPLGTGFGLFLYTIQFTVSCTLVHMYQVL